MKLAKGFSIVELLVVIAIIGILTAIITTNFSDAKARSRDAARVSDIANLQVALELYFDRCNRYPPVSSALPALTDNATTVCAAADLRDFISKIPIPPTTDSAYRYSYYVNSAHTDYILRTALELYNKSVLDDSKTITTGIQGSPDCAMRTSAPYTYCVGPR